MGNGGFLVPNQYITPRGIIIYDDHEDKKGVVAWLWRTLANVLFEGSVWMSEASEWLDHFSDRLGERGVRRLTAEEVDELIENIARGMDDG